VKKVFTILAIGVIIASCNSLEGQKPIPTDFKYGTTCTSNKTVKVPVLHPINLCSGGKSRYQKVVNWKDSSIILTQYIDVTIPSDSLAKAGYHYFPKDVAVTQSVSSADSGWFPSWLLDIFKYLFWLVLFLLGLWLIWQLINGLRRNSLPWSTTATTKVSQVSPAATTTSKTIEVIHVAMVGQPNDRRRDAPLFVISGANNKIGNITINMGDGECMQFGNDDDKPEVK
jgi:hypothetical protein